MNRNLSMDMTLTGGGFYPETLVQRDRIIADGGTIVDLAWMNLVIATLKSQGIYSNAKFLGDANMAVKKNGSGAVSVLYDISGNNNDAVQATGAFQPIWTAAQQNGKAGLVFNGSSHYLTLPNNAAWNLGATDFYISSVSKLAAGYQSIITRDAVGHRAWIAIKGADGKDFWTIPTGTSTVSDVVRTVGACYDVEHHRVGNVVSIYLNGTSHASHDYGAGYTIPDDTTAVEIGRQGDYGNYLAGTIFDVRLITGSVTTAQRQAVEAVVNGYYAIY